MNENYLAQDLDNPQNSPKQKTNYKNIPKSSSLPKHKKQK